MKKCICEKLRGHPTKTELLGEWCLTALYLMDGQLLAEGDFAGHVEINYCPFCGKKFEKNTKSV